MSAEIGLSIFKPLEQYFDFLYKINLETYRDIDSLEEIMEIVTSDKCDNDGDVKTTSKNFIIAMKNFANILKQYDTPTTYLTIKGVLETMFNETYVDLKGQDWFPGAKNINIDAFIKKYSEEINNNPICKEVNFHMWDKFAIGSESIPPSKNLEEQIKDSIEDNSTYAGMLKEIYSGYESNFSEGGLDNQIRTKLFGEWMTKVFNVYDNNFKQFEILVREILNNKNDGKKTKQSQTNLLKKYFTIYNKENKELKGFWDKDPDDYQPNKARLNVNPNSTNTMAKICELFPDSLKTEFNRLFLSRDITDSGSSYNSEKCFKFDKEQIENLVNVVENKPELIKLNAIKNNEIMNFNALKSKEFEKNSLISRRNSDNKYIADAEDNEEYSDITGEKNKFSFYAEEINKESNQDQWRTDNRGQLYKKNDKSGKYILYTDEDRKKDFENFMLGDDKCGNLCIFSDPVKCQEFFKNVILDNKTLDTEQVAKFISEKSFADNYNNMKENIVKVNPVYVIATLRAFGFKKWNSGIQADGNKVVKIESFTNWWDRFGYKLMETDLEGSKLSNKFSSGFPGTHDGLIPKPPANLELFLKLLVNYINNNEFVLNPLDGSLINSKQKTTLYPQPSESEIITASSQQFINLVDKNGKPLKDKNGNQLQGKNPLYRKNLTDSKTSLTEALKIAKSIPRLKSSGLKENIYGLDLLYNMMLGLGIGPLYGGSVGSKDISSELEKCINSTSDCEKVFKEISPYLGKYTYYALEAYVYSIMGMNKRGKKLDNNENQKIIENLKKLNEAEQHLTAELIQLAKYSRIINSVPDELVNEIVTLDTITDTINKAESMTKKVSKKSENFIEFVERLLKGEIDDAGSKSYYTSL